MVNKKFYFLLIVCFWFISNISAQEQKIADSLAPIYQQNTMPDTAKLELLRSLSFNEINDFKKGLKYAEELISLSKRMGNKTYLRVGYFLKGTKERFLGKLDEALE